MFDRPLFACRIRQAFAAGQLTRAWRDVGLALATYANRAGLCWPGRQAIADRAGCDVRTVARALPELRRLGLVDWQQRRQAWNRCASSVYTLAVTVRENLERRLPVGKSLGSPPVPADVQTAALARLAALLKCDRSAVLPWLAAS